MALQTSRESRRKEIEGTVIEKHLLKLHFNFSNQHNILLFITLVQVIIKRGNGSTEGSGGARTLLHSN